MQQLFRTKLSKFNLVHSTHGFAKAHCIVYQKSSGKQAYEQAERRIVTATPTGKVREQSVADLYKRIDTKFSQQISPFQ